MVLQPNTDATQQLWKHAIQLYENNDGTTSYFFARKAEKQMFKLLFNSLRPLHDNYHRNHQQRPIIRAHIGGDFFNQSYFLAWCDLALPLLLLGSTATQNALIYGLLIKTAFHPTSNSMHHGAVNMTTSSQPII